MVQAETTLVTYNSPKSISQAMDFAIKSNSLTYVYAQEPGRIDSINKAYTRPDSLKLQNPNTALFYAAVPGFFLHGMGHFYAKKPITGTILFGVEMLSLVFGFRSAIRGMAENVDYNEEVDAFFSVTLFLGSWIYDMIGAPLSISNKNEKILEKQRGLKFSII